MGDLHKCDKCSSIFADPILFSADVELPIEKHSDKKMLGEKGKLSFVKAKSSSNLTSREVTNQPNGLRSPFIGNPEDL